MWAGFHGDSGLLATHRLPPWCPGSGMLLSPFADVSQAGRALPCHGLPRTQTQQCAGGGAGAASYEHLFSTLHSVRPRWHPEIGRGGRVYTTEMGKCYKSGLLCFFLMKR